jgi:hypothetical protein
MHRHAQMIYCLLRCVLPSTFPIPKHRRHRKSVHSFTDSSRA